MHEILLREILMGAKYHRWLLKIRPCGTQCIEPNATKRVTVARAANDVYVPLELLAAGQNRFALIGFCDSYSVRKR